MCVCGACVFELATLWPSSKAIYYLPFWASEDLLSRTLSPVWTSYL